MVSGDAIPDESHKLLATVHFEADLTVDSAAHGVRGGKDRPAADGHRRAGDHRGSAAILLGFFLGGGRALYRMARGKPASSVYDEEFIQLDLREEWVESNRRRGLTAASEGLTPSKPVENRT
jgi:hypothetical protein